MPIKVPSKESVLRALIIKAKGEGAKIGTLYNLIIAAYRAFRGGMVYSELTTMVEEVFHDQRIGRSADFGPDATTEWVWVEVVIPYLPHERGDWLIVSRTVADEQIAEGKLIEIGK